MAAAVLVGVIYIVYKSIKQSVLLSALHPGGLVLLQRKTAQGWHGEGRGGTAATPQQTAWYQSGSVLIIVAVCKHQLLFPLMLCRAEQQEIRGYKPRLRWRL